MLVIVSTIRLAVPPVSLGRLPVVLLLLATLASTALAAVPTVPLLVCMRRATLRCVTRWLRSAGTPICSSMILSSGGIADSLTMSRLSAYDSLR